MTESFRQVLAAAVQVGLDRAEADVELLGDLGVGATAGDGQQDLLLAIGERIDRLRRLGL